MELHSPHRDPYNPINKLIDELKEKGYTHTFTVKSPTIIRDEAGKEFPASSISIMGIHRFENRENKTQNQMVIVYKTADGEKGYMLEKYGADEDESVEAFLQQADLSEAVNKIY